MPKNEILSNPDRFPFRCKIAELNTAGLGYRLLGPLPVTPQDFANMLYPDRFDVIVVGAGHAGTEAAAAAARTGAHTLLLTHNLDTVGQMSCNPAIGGIGKGHLVKEIDALGGIMGQAADACGIHFRTLNSRKGPAVRATRAQIDRALYKTEIRRRIESLPKVSLFQQAVDDLWLEGDEVRGVVTQAGLRFSASTVVMTTGTFLGGLVHIGMKHYAAGRAGDPSSTVLAARMRERAFRVARLKTGTPPRIDGRGIDFSALEKQPGERPLPDFSFLATADRPAQVDCYITHTNARTHEIIRAGLTRSPIYGGVIDGTGPRYCPSVEDKVVRFAAKEAHQIFVEPEGLGSYEVYPNGISTSLPFDVQFDLVRSICGFENAHITRPGYAIEYDYFDPRDLRASLETKVVRGLFFAGQINGTTGYEEAAAQGLIAGLNAARRTKGLAPWTPARSEAYIGVLIDDLVTRGTNEPYRMFTSRAEYRLLLREDNADLRLTQTGRELGLVGDIRFAAFTAKREAVEREHRRLEKIVLKPGEVSDVLENEVLSGPLQKPASLAVLLRRPGIGYASLHKLPQAGTPVADEKVAEQVEIQAKYHGYIQRQHEEIARNRRQERAVIPDDIDYFLVRGLSTEARQKLHAFRPATVGQAARISGVTPAAVSLLLVHLRRLRGDPQRQEDRDSA